LEGDLRRCVGEHGFAGVDGCAAPYGMEAMRPGVVVHKGKKE
jgi:hypothetical protein